MRFKLIATYKPTGAVQEYGPWEADGNPMVNASRISFAHGFVAGWNNHEYGPNFNPEDMAYEVVEVPEEPQNNVVGQLVAHASASVTHADGTVD